MDKSNKKIDSNKKKNFIEWLKNECRDWRTFVVLLCVIAVVYSPVWGGYLLYFIFKWKWCLVMASVTFTFWLGPFTPFFPLCIAITLFIKKIMQIVRIKKYKKNKKDKEHTYNNLTKM